MNERSRYKNIPNALSFLRLLMVPLFILLFFKGSSYLWAGLVFLLAGVTDVLDGYIARSTGCVTKFGRIIDPLADKLMQISAFACLAIRQIIPAWAILILAAKELTLLLGGWILLRRVHDVPPSNKYGKAASAVFYFVTIAVIVFDMPEILQICLLSGALFLSVAALLIYSWQLKKYLRERETSHKPQ
ncbi:MAG: CDP-diacylglycerol--glycerol-3-phosphate 3-phosphatidyltransferase [Clostridiales bacterium]|nr:CDP-diacylglycerol--glycerol-3-phosphate 3-phosphatidyltransferase [Clostridiales bacterium]